MLARGGTRRQVNREPVRVGGDNVVYDRTSKISPAADLDCSCFMNEPTPIVFYLPSASVAVDSDGRVDTAALLTRIGATDITFLHADLHQATWAGLTVNASAQTTDASVRLVVEFSSMAWIDMRLCHPDGALIHPDRSRHLIDEFAAAADALDCGVAFKSMTVLPHGWANWDVFLPDFDRVAAHRSARDLIRAMVDFGYAADDLEGVEWDVRGDQGLAEPDLVFESTPGHKSPKGTVWYGERMPALT